MMGRLNWVQINAPIYLQNVSALQLFQWEILKLQNKIQMSPSCVRSLSSSYKASNKNSVLVL